MISLLKWNKGNAFSVEKFRHVGNRLIYTSVRFTMMYSISNNVAHNAFYHSQINLVCFDWLIFMQIIKF